MEAIAADIFRMGRQLAPVAEKISQSHTITRSRRRDTGIPTLDLHQHLRFL